MRIHATQDCCEPASQERPIYGDRCQQKKAFPSAHVVWIGRKSKLVIWNSRLISIALKPSGAVATELDQLAGLRQYCYNRRRRGQRG